VVLTQAELLVVVDVPIEVVLVEVMVEDSADEVVEDSVDEVVEASDDVVELSGGTEVVEVVDGGTVVLLDSGGS
jgi:hypothetical protein